MRRLSAHLRLLAGFFVLAAAFGVGGCGGGTSGGATAGGPAPTATPIPCATHATTTATVWNESDKQIHGAIGGAAPTVLSDFHYPLDLPDESFEASTETPGRMVVSPDGLHIGVIMDVFVPNSRGYYPYVVDTTTHAVTRKGQHHQLSFYEVELLRLLHERLGQPVSREEILQKIWGVEAGPSNRTVDNFIVKLRKKIERSPDKPKHILTVYGYGYKLAP